MDEWIERMEIWSPRANELWRELQAELAHTRWADDHYWLQTDFRPLPPGFRTDTNSGPSFVMPAGCERRK